MGKQHPSSRDTRSARPYFVLFALTVMAFFVLSFFPHWRVWGLGTWVSIPVWVRLVLVSVAGIMAAGAWRWGAGSEDQKSSGRWYLPAAIVLGGLMAVLFVYLRQETHFLGDGYTLLKWLEDGGAINKVRNYGAQATLLILSKTLTTDALGVFRVTAWGAGLAALIGTFVAAARLYEDFWRRLLFALGVLSGGYMLLFFGYVENYALFVLMVLLFCLIGALGMLGHVRPWWSLLPLGGAVVYHIFGVTLIPAAAYLMLRDTTVGRWVGRLTAPIKWLIVLLGGIAGLIAFTWFYTHSYFFRFSFVPVVTNRFTVDGYTMFSPAHLADLLNLLVLLAPGVLVIALAMKHYGVKQILNLPVYRFLGLAALGGLGATFVFDPKLGMPRDWDLFSFSGVPLVVAGMLVLLESKSRTVGQRTTAALVVGLSMLSLWPRVVIQHTPVLGVAQFEIYRALDPIKNRNGGYFLIEYTRRTKGDADADRMAIEWNRTLQDQQYLNMANQVMQEGRFREALTLFQAALRENPVYWVAYTNIAEAYLNLGKSDSALEMLRIADGLNPKSPIIMSNLGQLYHYRGDTERALAIWRESAELDPAFVQPRIFLAKHYRTIRDRDNWLAMSEQIAALPDAPADNLAALADYYVSTRRFADAAPLYGRALAGGLDSTRVHDVAEKYPELREELNRWMSTATAE